MFKPKTLLKVISVLMIVMGILGVIGTVISYTVLMPQLDTIQGVDTSIIKEALTPLNLILSVLSSISCVLAGFFGVTGKSAKWASVFAGVYTAVLIISVVQTFIAGTFTALAVIDFIIPALYWWGLYQSK